MFNILMGIYKQRTLSHYWLPYLFYNGKAFKPLALNFEITYRCNQRCLMCPLATETRHESSKLLEKCKTLTELSTEEICNMVDEAKRMNINAIRITGGEAFLRKDIIQIIRYIKQQGLKCFMISNGTLIDKKQGPGNCGCKIG